MAFEAGSIKGTMGLDTEPAIASVHAITKESGAMKQQIERDATEAGNSLKEKMEGGLKSIKEQFGRRSILGEGLELAAGAGVGYALGEASSVIKEMAEGLGKIKEDFDAGKISAGEMGVRIAEGIPIIGGFITAGQSIHELFTNEKTDIEAINRESEQTLRIMESQTAEAESMNRIRKEGAAEIAASALKEANIGASSFDQERNNIHAGKSARDATAADANKAKIKEATASIDAEMAIQKQKLADAQAAQQAFQDNLGEAEMARFKKGQMLEGDGDNGGAMATTRKMQALITDAKDQSEIVIALQKKREEAARTVTSIRSAADQAADAADAKSLADIDARQKHWTAIAKDAGADVADQAKHDAERAQMEASGQGFAAEIQAIYDHATQIKKARSDAIEKTIYDSKADAATSAALRQQGADYGASIDKESAAEAIEAKKTQGIREADAASEARAMELKNSGNYAAAELEQIRRSYDDKIAAAKSGEERLTLEKQKAAATTGEALEEINRAAIEKLGGKESPLEKFNEEMSHILDAVKSGAITKDQALNIEGGLQKDLRDQMKTEDYHSTDQSVRRFNFSDLQSPEVADPLKDLVAVQTDAAADTKRTAVAMEAANTKIQQLQTWTPVAAP